MIYGLIIQVNAMEEHNIMNVNFLNIATNNWSASTLT